MLCKVCRNIRLVPNNGMNKLQFDKTSRHHQTFASLRESISSGCYVCSRLWSTLKPEHQLLAQSSTSQHDRDDEAEDEAGFRTQAWLWDYPGTPRVYALVVVLTPEWHEQDSVDWMKRFSIQAVQGKRSTIRSLLQKPNLAAQTQQKHCLSQKAGDGCRALHPKCNTIVVGNWYPTRLLDCGSSQTLDGDCRLVATNDTVVQGPYMTLSHCWGSTDCLKLTSTNCAKMMETISFATLPQLFRDAVQVTRNLGVRYLWIDSLCIIQEGDGLRDWSYEVTVMGQVYENSFCNISAARSPDSHHTMFADRRAESMGPELMSLDLHDHFGSYWIWEHDWWDQEVTLALINTRAWVLQERYLSPRVLYFGDRQLLWECRETSAAELHPKGTPDSQNFKGMASPLYAWAFIVQAYSNSHLTVPSDKIAALAGIVERFEKVFEDECVAGLWRRRIDSDLLWFMSGSQQKKRIRTVREATRPTEYRAPSWSWMAIDGSVVTTTAPVNDEIPLLYDVLDVKLEYATTNKIGPIKSGLLRMRGALKHPILVWRDQDWAFELRQAAFDEFVSEIMFDPPLSESRWEDDPEALYCMPAEVPTDHSVGRFSNLILQVVDRARGIFRRAGVAILVGDSIEEIFRDCSDTAGEFPCEDFVDGKHLITII